MQTHCKGARARVLLSSVFGPYAQDDEFGSRSINPMKLYHNQVTREQGPFSLRMFHRSWGILMIQKNISAPTTVLDFPTREAFAAHEEISVDHRLDRRNCGHVPADHNRRPRRDLSHHAAHLAHLADVHDDGRDAHDVVTLLGQFLGKRSASRKIENG